MSCPVGVVSSAQAWRGSCRWLLYRSRSSVLCLPSSFSLLASLFSRPQSMCEVLSPGLAVSVLKAIFQEVHVQVSSVISHPSVPALQVSGDGLPALRTECIL